MHVGVGFFFVLSGFVLAYSGSTDSGLAAYSLRRVARIYPSHFTMLIIALFALVPVAKSPEAFVASLFLVQSWFADPAIVYGLNGVAWTLSCEAAFYLGLPVALAIFTRVQTRVAWMIACGWLVASTLYSARGPSLSGRDAVWAFSHPVARFPEFLLGVVAALAFRGGWRPKIRTHHGLVALVGAGIVSLRLEPTDPLINQLFAPAFLVVIVAAAVGDAQSETGIVGGRYFVRAGVLSYCFYLVHELVIVNGQRIPVGRAALLIGSVIGSVLAAWSLHAVVERPAYLRWRTRSRPTVDT